MNMLKTPELLRKAADEIRRRGWTQDDFGSSNDRDNCSVCAWGAINAAAYDDPWDTGENGETESLADFVAKVNNIGGNNLALWNDHPDRTVEEVLEAFEKAARAAESEGN